ncbi:aldo/keto reductase [Glutamicibacter sp. 287]|uniref:aldo/keto reductase n=1 Tax=unclassified Glutamicibacter TaxID=2627139 RepID=UPI0040334440
MNSRLTTAAGAQSSPLVLGTNVFGWTADERTSHRILDGYVQAGGNFIDTADSYSFWASGNTGGESERIIGSWLRGRADRDELLIASKVSHHPDLSGLAPQTIRTAVDGSLQRLGVDYLDVYYAHFDDPDTKLEESIASFSALVDAGKIRAIGISNYSAPRIEQWLEITKREGFHAPVAIEPLYNLMERGIERDILPLACRNEMELYPYYSLAHGFLSGKYRTGANQDSARASDAAQYATAQGERVLQALEQIASARGTQLSSIALAWLRTQPGVTAPIASARTMGQLEPLLETMHLELDDEGNSLLAEASEPITVA